MCTRAEIGNVAETGQCGHGFLLSAGMTPTQEIELRQSELRVELADLAADADADPAAIELRTSEMKSLEVRRQAAIMSQPAPEVETRDTLAQVIAKASTADIVAAQIEGRSETSGATRELQDQLKMAYNVIPDQLLVEQRTTGQTPAPSTVGTNQQPIIAALFPRSATAFLGVEMPTVPVGKALFTLVTTDLSAGFPAAGAEHGHSAAAFTATEIAPSRVQGSWFIRREDRASLAGMESALRENANDALADAIDARVLGANGFLESGTLTAAPTTDSGTETSYGDYREYIFSAVDGIHASMASEVRVLLGAKTYQHASGQYRGNADNVDALQSMMSAAGGVRVSANIPDPAANIQSLIVARALGARHAVAPIWSGTELVVDTVTQVKSGEIVFTLIRLWGELNVLRKSAFVHRQADLA